MPLNTHLTLLGQKSGKIKGSVIQRGREGSCLVTAVSHEITTPRDPSTGMATGKRQHHPLIVTKPLDRASPALRQVLTTNEVLTEVVILFYKAEPSGVESQFFTIKLTNALVASVELQMPDSKHTDTMKLETFEQVAFVYQKIEWTWTETATTVVDDLTGAII